MSSSNVYTHSGVSMVVECVMKYSKPRSEAESLDSSSLTRRPECVKRDFSSFFSQMNEKNCYVGIVRGLSKSLSLANNQQQQQQSPPPSQQQQQSQQHIHLIVKNLCQEMRQACARQSGRELKSAMLKAAAFLTLDDERASAVVSGDRMASLERELLHEISICSCNMFAKETVEVAIECWSWLISARPTLEPLVVEQMLNAWQLSADLRLGMFAPPVLEPDPLAKQEHDTLRPRPPPHIDAHRVWIRYLQERLDIAKYKSALQFELFYHMMHKTLAFASQRVDDSAINRHVSCVGLRYRYLIMALSICQSSSSLLANTMAKWVLRERVYYAALEQFTVSTRTPTQSYGELREDIRNVLEFWNKMIAEKKYLKEENFAIGSSNGFLATSSAANGGGAGALANGQGSAGTPDTNSLAGVDVAAAVSGVTNGASGVSLSI